MDGAPSSPLANWPRPLCFVLSGGGSFGAVQVGMIRALHEAGIGPDLIVGTSVGALNGVQVANDPATAADTLTEVWAEISLKQVLGTRSRLGTAWNVLRNLKGQDGPNIYRTEALNRLIEAHLPAENIEDLTIPTAIVATDVLVGKPKVLRQGRLATALQASAAMPGVFPPVKIDGCFYVDGGVAANVPIRPAIAAGARSLVVLDAGPGQMRGFIPRTPLEAAVQASQIMLRNQVANATEELVKRHPIIRLPQPTPPALSSFDFSHTLELIDAGFVATKGFLADLPDLADTSRRI